MKTDLKHIRKYMNGGKTEAAKAFAIGYCRAMRDCGYAVTDPSDPQRYVNQQILREEAVRYKQGWEEAETICQTFGVPKADFRAMMLDCDAVDDCGREVNFDGDPIKSQAEHKCYMMTDYIGDGFEEVAYVDLTNAAGDHYRVYKNDLPFISYLLQQDIMIGDPINERYAEEAQPGGMLEEYANVIREALCKCPHRWLSSDVVHTTMTLPEAEVDSKMRAMAEREVPSSPYYSEPKQWSPGDYQRLAPKEHGEASAIVGAMIDLIDRAEAIAKRKQMSDKSFNAMIRNVLARVCAELEDFEGEADSESGVLPNGLAVLPVDAPSEGVTEDGDKNYTKRGRPRNNDAGKSTTKPKASRKGKKDK